MYIQLKNGDVHHTKNEIDFSLNSITFICSNTKQMQLIALDRIETISLTQL